MAEFSHVNYFHPMLNTQKLVAICILSSLILFHNPTGAHPGRTNSSGCHNDNINDGYHCHNGGSGSGSSGSGSSGSSTRSSPPSQKTPVCRVITSQSYSATLTKNDESNFKEGQVYDLSGGRATLGGNLGYLLQYRVGGLLVKKMDYDNSSLSTQYTFETGNPWIPVIKTEDYENTTNDWLENNFLGIRNILFETVETSGESCS